MKFNFKKAVRTFIAGVAVFTQITATTPIFAEKNPVKIGANYELSGDTASYGKQMLEGLELAVEQVNNQGGVLGGRKLEIVSYDNKSDVTEAVSVAQRLASSGVVGVVGPALTAPAEAQIPILTKAKVPNVLPAATGDDLTLDKDGKALEYVFRVCFKNAYQGQAGASFAVNNLKAKKAVILVDQGSDYSRGLADNFIKEFEKDGGKVVSEQSFTSGDQDFSSILTTAMGQDFDVLYIPSYYTEAGMIIKQAREMGIEQPIVGPDGFSSEVLTELAGVENVNNIYFTDHFSVEDDTPKVKEFMTQFEEKFDKQGGTWNALGYDAAMLIVDAIERSGSDNPEKVTKAIAETKAFDGVTGTFAIDKEHNPVKPAVVIEMQEGKVKNVHTVKVD